MKVLIAGDFCPLNRISKSFQSGDYEAALKQVKLITETEDYSIVNLECPIVDGDEKHIEKYGPSLSCSSKMAEALVYAGFDCVTLANNHFFDYGTKGVYNTLAFCEKYKVDTVGGGGNLSEAAKPLIKDVSGKKIAIINCCEHEFSIASSTSPGCNPLNPIAQYYEIKKVRNIVDYILIIVHGGHEHYQLPSVRQQDTYRFFIDAGADAVVNHHQHCYSGYELYQNKPIFYGLGNFCFDHPSLARNKENWGDGYMVELDFGLSIKFKIYPYRQCVDKPIVELLDLDVFDSKLNYLNKIISDREELFLHQNKYYSSEIASILSIFQPFRSRFAFAARKFGILKSIMPKKWQIALWNYIMCESHRDKVEFFLKNYNK